jgi:pyridoxal phosphate enzyme (YggS family)
MSIAANLALVRHNVDFAIARRREAPVTGSSVKVVAVTKNQDAAAVREVLAAGAAAVGENRVQEASAKAALLPPTEWHLIGHLQTNKVRQAVPLFSLIHSLDSERLALEMERVAAGAGKRQDVLIQVNVAGEETKSGVAPDGVRALAELVSGLPHVRLCGLMTMAPFYDDAEEARPVFRELYRLFAALKAAALPDTSFEWLSMGMTNDYAVAVEEGANLVRIGTAIFGPRHY